ncbi:SDR family oxidoreductase [Frankia sp. Cppng1_Ct_nod]|uniref:SDR family NAD(P)-dependent oxidoreductase n=1 Tax=Frankia sp. Cppng1_Ct_nod TaxID=2897162 RepID=UPI00104140D3|nr:SDR family oxidoreductase [Frankia sp. Cppng1_Ct_nod]
MILNGHVALVTAAAGAGIGRAVARRLAAEGAAVVVTDRHEGRSVSVAADIAAEFGVETLALPFDVTDTGRAAQVVDLVTERFGGIDILVNNAAINTMEHLLHEVPPETFDRLWAANYRTPHELVVLTLPYMVHRRWGVIVNITSTAPFVGAGYFESPYAIAKGALHQLSRAVAVEYSRYGVRSNAVAPGAIWNERDSLLGLMPQAYWDDVLAFIPQQRFGTPEEISGVVSFLCSEDAAYVQGNVIQVGGGINLGGPPQQARFEAKDL